MIKIIARLLPRSIKYFIYDAIYEVFAAAARHKRLTEDSTTVISSQSSKFLPGILIQYEKRINQLETEVYELKKAQKRSV